MSCRAAANARFPFATEANLFSCFGSGWDIDADSIGPHDSASASACTAGTRAHRRSPPEARAGLAKLHRPLSYRFAAAAFAIRASRRPAAGFCPGALADLARDGTLQCNCGLKATHRVQ